MADTSKDELLPVLQAALNQTRSAACITTAELDAPGPEIVYVNPAYCVMTGRTEAEVIGDTPRIMQGPLTDRAVLDQLRADLEAGRPFVGETVNYRKDGTPYLINWRIDPVVAGDGRITHFIATQEDITRLRRAERLLSAEQAIDRALSTVLSDPGDTTANLRALGERIVAATAELVGYGKVGLHGSMMLGTASEPFSSGRQLPAIPDADGVAPGTTSDHLRTGTVGEARWVAGSLASTRTGIDGALSVSDLNRAEFDFIDTSGLERITECVLRALNSLAEYERQRLLAIELQRHLLPTSPTTVPGLDIAALYQPGAFGTRIGGDWYDVIVDDNSAVFFVGDVAGSGVGAAADMGRLRLLVRVLLQQGVTVPDVFSQLNRFCADEDLVATALVVTVELTGGRYDGGAIGVVSAGHPPPLRTTGDGASILEITPGPLLGIGGNPDYPERRFELSDRDQVLLYTDGLVERSDETIDTSLSKLASSVADGSWGEDRSIDTLCSWLIGRRLGDGASDDIAVIGFQPRATGGAGSG